MAPPIVARLRLRHKIIEQSTEENEKETSEDEESTEEIPFHTSENYIKSSLYKRLITSKTEVTSLSSVIKEMR